ncbi:Hypothetical predicted protein [Mytilus galloprovincialis]|uniref:Uncharacterized protein n=1 Tax=Mytilus galloprovincialis TaxID=29158 RepID=A0A8B6HGV8_MYTGA|nr:Hypothetical predicted protein [Mytilus galloprovincialis]
MLDRHSSEKDAGSIVLSYEIQIELLDKLAVIVLRYGIQCVVIDQLLEERCWIVIVLRYGILCVVITCWTEVAGCHSSEVWNTMCCYTAAGQKDAGSS